MTGLENDWVQAVILVRFDERDGQKIQGMYPRECFSQQTLSTTTSPAATDASNQRDEPSILQDIKMLSMPDCLDSISSMSSTRHHAHEFLFMIRLHDKARGTSTNGYVSFRQFPDDKSRRGYFQQSLVLVSSLPFVTLFYQVLTRLSQASILRILSNNFS